MSCVSFNQPEIANALAFVYKDRIVCKLFSQIEVLKNINVNAQVTTRLNKTEGFNVSTDGNGFLVLQTQKLQQI